MILVGRTSSTIGVEGRRTDACSTVALLVVCFWVGVDLGVDLGGAGFFGVVFLGGGVGDEARRFAADSRRSRAGRTRFCEAVSAIDFHLTR